MVKFPLSRKNEEITKRKQSVSFNFVYMSPLTGLLIINNITC